jgi:hypothetical protein
MFAFALPWLVAAAAAGCLPADHKEAPIVNEDPAADINDVYVFQSPANPDNFVFAMTVNPFIPPVVTLPFNFSPNVRYRFLIDANRDRREDQVIEFTFTAISGGVQNFTVLLPDKTRLTGQVTPPSVAAVAPAPIIASNAAGVMAFAGQTDDPFFFDLVGFNRFRAGTGTFSGTDAFTGFNVGTMCVEIPRTMLRAPDDLIQVWAVTERKRSVVRRASTNPSQLLVSTGTWEAVDRMGNPAVSTVFIPSAKKNLFNVGKPARDAVDFGADIVASLQSLGTNSTNIAILASVAVPDTIKVNLLQPTMFPNGRAPADDVIDTLLFFIFNQVATPDGVNANDVAFPMTFPYFATPHQPP